MVSESKVHEFKNWLLTPSIYFPFKLTILQDAKRKFSQEEKLEKNEVTIIQNQSKMKQEALANYKHPTTSSQQTGLIKVVQFASQAIQIK